MTLLLRGDIHHLPIWFFYSFVNYTGLILCSIYAYSLFRNKRFFNAVDIGVLNLLSGIFVMCIFCATQCLRNFVGWSEYFQDWGNIGCGLEAVGHVVAIEVQFMAVTQVAYYQYCTVRRSQLRQTTNIAIRPHQAIFHVICIWVYSVGGALLTLLWSKTELLPAGSYCFPTWTSPMALWLAVSMVFSLTLAILCYIKVFEITDQIAEAVAMLQQRTHGDPSKKMRDGARRTVLLMVGYGLGWGFAPIACIWAWFNGDITQALELLVGIFGSLHSWFVPLIYGKQAVEVKKFIRGCATYRCCPACIKARCEQCFPELQERLKNKDGDVTIVMKRYESNHPAVAAVAKESKSSSGGNNRQTMTISSMMPLPPPMEPEEKLTICIQTANNSPASGSPNMDPGRVTTNATRPIVITQQDQYSPSLSPPMSTFQPSVKQAWPVAA